jgi:hypothetical protein
MLYLSPATVQEIHQPLFNLWLNLVMARGRANDLGALARAWLEL